MVAIYILGLLIFRLQVKIQKIHHKKNLNRFILFNYLNFDVVNYYQLPLIIIWFNQVLYWFSYFIYYTYFLQMDFKRNYLMGLMIKSFNFLMYYYRCFFTDQMYLNFNLYLITSNYFKYYMLMVLQMDFKHNYLMMPDFITSHLLDLVVFDLIFLVQISFIRIQAIQYHLVHYRLHRQKFKSQIFSFLFDFFQLNLDYSMVGIFSVISAHKVLYHHLCHYNLNHLCHYNLNRLISYHPFQVNHQIHNQSDFQVILILLPVNLHYQIFTYYYL